MKRLASILLLSIFVLGLGLDAMAQKTPVVDRRERRQQRRIRQGVKNGSLNKRETVRLEKQQLKTEKMEQKAKSDGVVTRKERARLQHRENKTSRHIYRQKHDNQNR